MQREGRYLRWSPRHGNLFTLSKAHIVVRRAGLTAYLGEPRRHASAEVASLLKDRLLYRGTCEIVQVVAVATQRLAYGRVEPDGFVTSVVTYVRWCSMIYART